ncbi:MAG: Daunorubicin/doxorubicin resistance ATP-binding protein DrrA [Alphaproteobacteria bacterium MarineAlpha5_Bin11]|nr:ABC transporter [Pelagibacteraceae bacterium]PPR45172.1 MAG: Daunorubicin/doxorubicin resistance ATP-binding protein DrrA [Alphaproteobacteria bacterium MarineAlpha5_Bin11]PPR52144.1 MAG: Daunorubicin/doxorubicin resistance ATP-binding protein DrrA [Alphaproteobacteria bacterium MarineAlpha5_Bin10]|tara:strand:+ start:10122 stop:11060 length:939 start_codon:yes stop_codon:yes gene_type:complete
MSNDTNLAIEAKGLNKSYVHKYGKKVKALIDFDIKIPKGVTYGLLGPNGAGKSTFINILGGLVIKNSGDVKVCGINLDKNLKKCRKLIGIVPQELNMDPFFTPLELLELQAGLYGVKKKERKTLEILKSVGLTEQKDSYARNLSGGMKRRLLVAKALVHDPEVVILDEPTAGVDVELRQKIWGHIKELNKEGVTVCLTTHYLQEAEQLCDYISIINKGKIIISDKKNNILNLISKKTVNFLLEEAIYNIPENLQNFSPEIKDQTLSISYDKNNTNLKDILILFEKNKIKFKEINTFESDLEDVFIELTKEKN